MSSRRRHNPLLPVFAGAAVASCVFGALLASGALYELTEGSSVGLVLTIAASAAAFLSVFVAFGVLLFAATRPLRRPATGSPAPRGSPRQ